MSSRGHVPARREAGLVEHHRRCGLGDDPVAVPYHQVARGLPDVDAVVRVGGVTEDAFVLLVEGVHRPPGEGDPAAQVARVLREVGVLPRGPLRLALTGVHA